MELRRFLVTFAIVVTCVRPVYAQETVRFEDYFTEGALRVDIIHAGTNTEDEISIRRVIREPVWSGPRANLIPDHDMGMYRFDVIDDNSGDVIYRYGFSTLFGEWITTDEAKRVRRAFEETLEMPYPKSSVTLRVYKRKADGKMTEIFSAPLDPNHHQVGRSPVGTGEAGPEIIEIQVSGSPSEKVDVVILGDGYAPAEKEKFRGDCRRFAENFFAVEPFRGFRERFNVRAVFIAAEGSGIDEPRKGVYRDTPFGMTFNMFDLPRYCMTEDMWAIHDAAAHAAHDAILIMANSSRYGGGAIYNHYTVFVSDNEYDDYLTVHEFGHGFGGLGDEYFTSAVAYNEFYPQGVEPWEPNITALLDPEALKWKTFVKQDIPLPTPGDDPAFANVVGAFEGAGYAAKGLYRPARDCKMFSKGNRDFCKVCEHSLIEMIEHYAPSSHR